MPKTKANRPKVAARAGSKKAAAKTTKHTPKDKSERARAEAIGRARAEVAANLAAIDAQTPDAAATVSLLTDGIHVIGPRTTPAS